MNGEPRNWGLLWRSWVGCPLMVGTPVKSLELLEHSELEVSSVTKDVLVGNCRDETGSLWTYAGIWTWRWEEEWRRSGERRAAMAGFTPRRIFTAAVKAGWSTPVPVSWGSIGAVTVPGFTAVIPSAAFPRCWSTIIMAFPRSRETVIVVVRRSVPAVATAFHRSRATVVTVLRRPVPAVIMAFYRSGATEITVLRWPVTEVTSVFSGTGPAVAMVLRRLSPMDATVLRRIGPTGVVVLDP